MSFNIPDIIRKKRDGNELSKEEIDFFVLEVVNKTVQDSQIGAMLMAIFLKGFRPSETVALTKAMIETGEKLEFSSSWDHLLVDKHSTGGVGDKISLVLAPALAAWGLKVPMVSGRGLDFTGGTLDKLESIPGFKVQLSSQQMIKCLQEAGCFIAGPTSALAPADGVLYKHRDVTSTVDSLPLIASSILSKKVAEGTKALVMDVKVGRGTFFKRLEDAKEIAKTLIEVGSGLGVETKVVMSQMDVPIGAYIGNALEVAEAVDCLKNQGSRDVNELVKVLGGVLLLMKGVAQSLEDGKARIEQVLENGAALKRFQQMIVLQGVSQTVAVELCLGDMWKVLPRAQHVTPVNAATSGTIVDIDAIKIAKCCWHLGAGRKKADDAIDYSVGLRLVKTVGDVVESGDRWVEVHHTNRTVDEEVMQLIRGSIDIRSGANVANTTRVIDIM